MREAQAAHREHVSIDLYKMNKYEYIRGEFTKGAVRGGVHQGEFRRGDHPTLLTLESFRAPTDHKDNRVRPFPEDDFQIFPAPCDGDRVNGGMVNNAPKPYVSTSDGWLRLFASAAYTLL